MNQKVNTFMLVRLFTLLFFISSYLPAQSFEPTIKSLSQYQCPKWFRDAKFGIYSHWNAQTASKSSSNGWYARDMYIEGSQAYNDHLKNWGHPSKVGYKDIIEAWKVDKFNATEWVNLFKEAGAKYILTMAGHHDNFDMWDSKYQPKWNSMNYGPRVDVCKEVREATLKAGLRWGVTTHISRSYSWWAVNKDADKKGKYLGKPYDGNNPDYTDLYHRQTQYYKEPRDILGGAYYEIRSPLWSPDEYKKKWKNRMLDLIDRYHPDYFYFDAAVPFMDDLGKTGLEVISHYYNHNAMRHDGKNQGVMVFKNHHGHGVFYKGIATQVMEREFSVNIEKEPRQTETSTGPWFYTGTNNFIPKEKAKDIIHNIVDVVSKNNNLLLNVPPKSDGSFDKKIIQTLKIIGKWLRTNGEAIFHTRPWHVFGEKQIRYTTHGKILYVIMLEKPSATLEALSNWTKKDIKNIKRMDNGKVIWRLTKKGLKIISPDSNTSEAYVFKIECYKDVAKLPMSIRKAEQSVKNINEMEKFGFDGNGNKK